MKARIVYITFSAVSEIFALSRWTSCWLFKSDFYFTFQSLSTQLLIASNEEKGLPLILIRAMHNKLTGFVWGISQTVLQYIDIRFLFEFLGIGGAIGVYLGFWYFFTKKPKNGFLWGVLFVVIILSSVEMLMIFHIGFSQRIIPLALLFMLFSLLGIWQFLTYGNTIVRFGVITILLIISFLAIFLFPHSLYSVCLKV